METSIKTRRNKIYVKAPPPLESGDRLPRAEFERRYQEMPDLKKAELIEGVVYVGSPVRQQSHGRPHSFIITWLGTYVASTPGVDIGDNTTVRLDIDNEPQPDALLRVDTPAGHSAIGADDYVEGPPELVVEIAASSASYDMHDKLHVYRRNQVQEYLVWRVYEQVFDWWELHDGQYEQLPLDDAGVFRSSVFPGLWLDTEAIYKGDLATVLTTLQLGLETDEHAAFIARLAEQKA